MDAVDLARSLAQELVGRREFGEDLEDAAQLCLEYLQRAMEQERHACLKIASGFAGPEARQIATRMRRRGWR